MRSLPKQLAVATGIGLADMGASVAATSGWMHRDLTHGAWEAGPEIEHASRTVLWGNGMLPRQWAQLHREHHDHSDIEGDPHSPVINGMMNNLTTNHIRYKKRTDEYTDEDLDSDLQPDSWDRAIYDRRGLGMASSFAGHIALNKLAGNNPLMGVVSWSVGKVGYVAAGNFVNTLGHGGKKPLKALFTGKIEPHEDGSYGADNPILALVTGGEGNQKYHHDHPESLVFTDEKRPVRRKIKDTVGAAAELAIKFGLGKKAA
jgi:fatty-acid desaturase